MPMRYAHIDVVHQEVPGEISLCFSITGCPLRCMGCHSPHTWKAGSGKPLTAVNYQKLLQQYQGFASCVLFMGGEWHPETLISYLKEARQQGYATCLYTGENSVAPTILQQLTYVKLGPWIPNLGGLNNTKTNQQFIEVSTGKKLNHLFIAHDKIKHRTSQ